MFDHLRVCRLAVLVISFGLALPSGLAKDDAELNRMLKEATELYDARDYARAIELYDSILKFAPYANNVRTTYAEAKYRHGDKDGALRELSTVLNSEPDHAGAFRVRALILYRDRDYQGSLGNIELAIRYNPENVWAHALRADIHVALNNTEEALADLTRAIEIDPERPLVFLARAQLHSRRSEHSFALADYSRAIQLNPQEVDGMVARGWLRFYRHDWAGALQDARRTIELAQLRSAAHRLAGYALYAQGDHAAAVNDLTESILLDKDPNQHAYPMFVRHLLLSRLKQPDRQLATATAQWRAHPWLQAIGRFITGEIDESAFEKAARDEQMPGRPSGRLCEMHYYIGMVRLLAGDISTARLRFQSSLATGEARFVQYVLAETELKRL